MGENLRDELKIFMEIGLKLIDLINRDLFEDLETLIEERQNIINVIEGLNYSNSEFTMLCEEYDIAYIEETLTKLMQQKKLSLKSEIDKFSEGKHASKSYNSKFSADSIYFNKKF